MTELHFDMKMGRAEEGVDIPEEEVVYSISPRKVDNPPHLRRSLMNSFNNPVGSDPISDSVERSSNVTILADDITRPTPQDEIIPPLLDELNGAGIEDGDITLIVALGTHRYMTQEELLERFGGEVMDRIEVINHEWKNEDNLVELGKTAEGIPIEVNKIAHKSDYLIGVGSIVPHVQAGWGGGCKILQPGICSDRTTQETHLLAARQDDYLGLAGDVDNPVRKKIEEIGLEAGLDFIVNVVLDGNEDPAQVVAGDPVKAHRKGVEAASRIFVREIPQLADVVIVEAYPADIDYWQGIKALAYAQHGVKEGGTVILVAGFSEGISPVHGELARYGRESYGEIRDRWDGGEIEDGVCAAALFLHSEIKNHSDTICVSNGMTSEDKRNLGFEHAESVERALKMTRRKIPRNGKVGIIKKGGDVLPRLGG